MLSEHGIYDLRESLIRSPQAVAAGEEVAFEPALAAVLAKDFHDPAVRTYLVVDRDRFLDGTARRGLEEGIKPIGVRLIRTKKSEVCRIELDHVAKELP